MRYIRLGRKELTLPGEDVYVIAEIGQNHQGCIETAKKMIMEAKNAGCHCVKFQKSCLREKFTKHALSRPYNNVNSWGSTYGEHKEYLEFSLLQYKKLQEYCKEIDIDFTASAMDEVSLKELEKMNVPFIKIGSGDANNFPLIELASKMETPIIISVGMQNMSTIVKLNKIMINSMKRNYAFLHCVSSYPTDFADCNLLMIRELQKTFCNVIIGYSGHELGIQVSEAALLLGARIIERHLTLDQSQKGSDHCCSLEPHQFKSLVNKISILKENGYLRISNYEVKDILEKFENNKNIASALGKPGEKSVLPCEMPCKLKLGKSIVAAKYLKAGETLKRHDIKIKVSEPNGIPAEHFYEILGCPITNNIEEDSPLMFSDIHIS